MTWTKFGAEFRDECAEAELSDAAFRTHVEAIMYLYGIEAMDMQIQRRLVRKWAGSDHYQAAIDELVRLRFWVAEGSGWKVIHHEDVFRQSLAAQQKKRTTEKERQRNKRAVSSDTNTGTNVGTNTDTNVGPTQSVRQTDRQSSYNEAPQSELDDENIDEETGEILDPSPDPWANQPSTYPSCSIPGCAELLVSAQRQQSGVCFVHSKRAAA